MVQRCRFKRMKNNGNDEMNGCDGVGPLKLVSSQVCTPYATIISYLVAASNNILVHKTIVKSYLTLLFLLSFVKKKLKK